jgi:tetratricopeptide (TPR) repeat protein
MTTLRSLLVIVSLMFCASSVATAGTLETNPEANRADPDFVAGKKAIERKDWKVAIEHFKAANKRLENADLHSYLGFAFRKSGDLDSAFTHYKVALGIDPNHRGTHEYLGEAYVKAGNLDKARQHLARLEEICGKDCEEYLDLSRAISTYEKSQKNR